MIRHAPESLLERFCGEDEAAAIGVALVAAHPDDEVIGAGARLLHLRRVAMLHVTDGSPLDLTDALAAGCPDRQTYAARRRRELAAALQIAGAAPSHTDVLGVTDQHASLDLVGLTAAVAQWLQAVGADVVLTHPYEGGHPDHDATAFAVHHAVESLRDRGGATPLIVEMSSYHNGPTGLTPCCFLPSEPTEQRTLTLSLRERRLKAQMFASFASQAATLEYFPVQVEPFRIAPRYDFTRPPHEGTLFYENHPWGMRGQTWRQLAAAALDTLAARVHA